MGYSEKSCQICAVSFNIARLRTKDEPPEAGWGYSHGMYYAGDSAAAVCAMYPEQSGCEKNHDGPPELEDLHFPGRFCTYDGGYNGWKIGVEEMKGMRHPRYIIQKPKNHDADESQEDYERESDFFVSSQTTEVPDDFEPGALAKVRFGINDLYAQNYRVVEHSDESPVGVPVHDACWKIFERVSRLRLGKIDLQGFMALWNRQACYTCGFQRMNQDPMIQQCKEQFWSHLPGTEYFGANPHDVPGLMLYLNSCYTKKPLANNVFSEVSSIHDNKTDRFRLLPAELKIMILSDLCSKDIASLRMVSRSFRCLPTQLFLHLIQKELPWFWELDELEAFMARLDADYHNLFGIPEKEDHSFNWHVLYKELCSVKKNLLGIRNRVRVWNLAEEIIRRTEKLRYGLVEGDDLPLMPTEKEREEGPNDERSGGFYCSKCDLYV